MSESPSLFVKKPGQDFTRNRKLPFDAMLQILISMGGNTIYKELLEAQGFDVNTATTSAFVQQRDKILPFALEFLLHEFMQSLSNPRLYRGYRLLGVDGSDTHIAVNPSDPNTFLQSNPDSKGYNLLHLNALYDLCNNVYIDTITQPRLLANEGQALVDMVNRSRIGEKVILTADRGYESYNTFAHIERKGWNYVIRVKDIGSNGILSGLRLPQTGEFDVTIHRILTRSQSKKFKALPDVYRILSSAVKFDFLDEDNKSYPMSFRIARFKISDDTYETLITNLEQPDFSVDELKNLYNLRWGIETSFRSLKYSIGLVNFHAKKQEYIAQEIFARIITYNFTMMIASHVIISQKDTQYDYQVNFTVAVHVCKHFLRPFNNVPVLEVEVLIGNNILPVRPDRKFKRNIRKQSAVNFIYRVA